MPGALKAVLQKGAWSCPRLSLQPVAPVQLSQMQTSSLALLLVAALLLAAPARGMRGMSERGPACAPTPPPPPPPATPLHL